jgi:hypothetical protein
LSKKKNSACLLSKSVVINPPPSPDTVGCTSELDMDERWTQNA